MMKDKDIEKILQEQAAEVPIPESLKPEHMMKKIEAKEQKKKKARYTKYIAAAASCALIVGIGIAGFGGLQSRKEQQMVAQESSQKPLQVTSIKTAEDYKEIYRLFEQAQKTDRGQKQGAFSRGAELAKGEVAVGEVAAEATVDASYPGEYSDTNVREEGVGEADIVKTDGERMYVLNYPRLDIVDISTESIEKISSVELPQEGWFGELYVKGDRMVVVYTLSEDTKSKEEIHREYTIAETFDIRDPANPKSMGQIKQSGAYYTARFVGDDVYLMSHYFPGQEILREDEQSFVPLVQGEVLDSKDIFMPMLDVARSYTVISAYSLQDPEKITDKKAILGGGDLSYVSKENLYLTETEYGRIDQEESFTCIRKISYKDGILSGVGQTKVAGRCNDSFCLDEYKGNLRLVTTLQESNTLYILDEKLKALSKLEGLAKEEQVYSARFMGDTGYFVTFRQIDPLFSVDLRDPKNPKILGELKIPGFSEYLHPYGEGKLLGIGMHVDETGTTTEGVKLSMFDISDPKDVKEEQQYVIKDTYATDVAYNYKVAFVQPEKNLIGFVVHGEESKYSVFSYDPEQGFTRVFERNMQGLPNDVRAFYVGDKFYLVAGYVLESYDLDTFEKIDDLVL